MTTQTASLKNPTEEQPFETEVIAPVVLGHISLDIYPASVAPLLPVLIEKMTLTLTQAGLLTSFLQIPGILNPFIGYIADKVSFRYFVILAPAMTATFIGSMGYAPNYWTLALLLFFGGVSVACFHAPAPAMIGQVSGRKVGLGMSLFMAAGELAYAIGPLLAVWAVTAWTLEGYARLMVIGWSASIFLWFRLRNVAAQIEKPGSLRAILPALPSLYLPIALFILARYPLMESLSTFLPTLMSSRGATLIAAGASLSIYMISGVAGVLVVGPASDRWGRKPVLVIVTLSSAALSLVFLTLGGWAAIALLPLLGFFTLSTNPIMMAMTQERFPNNRAMANGLFMMLSFMLKPIGTISVGFIGDHVGLEQAMLWGALVSLLALIPIMKLPEKPVTGEVLS